MKGIAFWWIGININEYLTISTRPRNEHEATQRYGHFRDKTEQFHFKSISNGFVNGIIPTIPHQITVQRSNYSSPPKSLPTNYSCLLEVPMVVDVCALFFLVVVVRTSRRWVSASSSWRKLSWRRFRTNTFTGLNWIYDRDHLNICNGTWTQTLSQLAPAIWTVICGQVYMETRGLFTDRDMLHHRGVYDMDK